MMKSSCFLYIIVSVWKSEGNRNNTWPWKKCGPIFIRLSARKIKSVFINNLNLRISKFQKVQNSILFKEKKKIKTYSTGKRRRMEFGISYPAEIISKDAKGAKHISQGYSNKDKKVSLNWSTKSIRWNLN